MQCRTVIWLPIRAAASINWEVGVWDRLWLMLSCGARVLTRATCLEGYSIGKSIPVSLFFPPIDNSLSGSWLSLLVSWLATELLVIF